MHTNTQIRPLDMRRRDTAHVRSANFDMWDGSQNAARAIPIIAANLPVNLVKLPKIHVRTKPFADRAKVRFELVAGDLVAANRSLAKIEDESERVESIPCADVMRDHQLSFAVHAMPEVEAAPFFGIVESEVVFLRVDESPHLIK